MSIRFGATCFFNKAEDFKIVSEVGKQFPLIQYVEFRGEHPFLIPDVVPQEQLRYYKQILQQANLKSTLHTTMYDINLSTLNPWLKDANIACYKRYIDVAEFLGSEVIVVHGGFLQTEFDQSPLREEFIDLAEKHLCETLTALAEYGEPKGVKVALENSPPKAALNIVHNPQTQIKILERIDHPNLGALLDFAHAFLNKLNLLDYLEKIRPYLFEIHAHNNFGEEDDHLGLPNGNIDYVSILNHPAVHDLPFIMEIKSYQEVVETLNWLDKLVKEGEINI